MRWFKPKKQIVAAEQVVAAERIVATIGETGNGKTIFLASLFWDSFFALSKTFQDWQHPYAVRALNEEASNLFFGNAIVLNKLELPEPSPHSKTPPPAILEFKGIPYAYGQRRQNVKLTFYDIGGEVFRDDRRIGEFAPYLVNAHDIVFLFDRTHPDFGALRAAQLVDRVYRVAAGSERKNLIIAVTKMDVLRDYDEWWTDIAESWPGTPPASSGLFDYLNQMDKLSERLRDWWAAPEQDAYGFINNLPATTRYCAISSLGHQPFKDGNGDWRLTRKPEPFRVRDPLFWIFRAAGVM